MVSEKNRNKIVDTFLNLITEKGYEAVTLLDVADAASVRLADFRQAFDGKVAIIEAFSRRIDAEVLDNIDKDVSDELPREQLMDILLTRLDALSPYKQAMAALMKTAQNDLTLAAQLNRVTLVSMTWLLNAAHIKTAGAQGALKVQGLALVYGRVLRVWLQDDESMAKTMAAVDKELRSGERMLKRFDSFSRLLAPLKRMRTRQKAEPVPDVPVV